MAVLFRFEEHSPFLQQVDDHRIGIFKEHPGDRFHRFNEMAVQANTMHYRQTICLSQC